jgi:N-acetylneuraminic acid mutarotase
MNISGINFLSSTRDFILAHSSGAIAQRGTLLLILCALALSLSACGGGGSNTPPPPSQFTIGGTDSGLAGTGLVLQDNGGGNLSVSANGSFTFATTVASGGAYSVTVLTQPSSPAQTCAVTNGSGTATANVTNVQVACTTVTHTIGGMVSNLVGTNGGLQLEDNGSGTLNVNGNGSFTFAMAVADGSAYAVTISMQPSNPAQTCGIVNGAGTATASVTNVVVDCGHNEWTWMGGSDLANQPGVYGTMGTPSASNVPGARDTALVWTDSSGSIWLFGGLVDSQQNRYNDLWKYSAGQWTWVGGSNMINQPGNYGTLGTPSATNMPGARSGSVRWTDSSGNVWLFGGKGYDSVGTLGDLNDLWKYSGGQWTWMGGSNLANQKGVYGTLGTPSANNIPGGRRVAVARLDLQGNLWLFGGFGFDSAGSNDQYLNDLWKYSSGEWTWMGGSNLANQKGVYGGLGMPSGSNIPGGRGNAVGWTDASGSFWLFGGAGYDSTGTAHYSLNDLWKYNNGQWTWMSGSKLGGVLLGQYGTQGTPSAANDPGGRGQYGSVGWTDASGNFWLFGGFGYDAVGTLGELNDLWKYSNGQWTWMSGSDLADPTGFYGVQGAANPNNFPGGRDSSSALVDAQGNLWLFGGRGYDSTGTLGELNDLWKYEP